VPQQHDPGQGRHVVRRHLRGRFPGGEGLPGQGQGGLRPRPRRGDQVLRLALHLGLGHPGRLPQPRQGLEVRLLGLRQAVRAAGRRPDRLVQGAGRHTRLDVHQPRLRQGGRRLPGDDQGGHRAGPAERPRSAAAARAWVWWPGCWESCSSCRSRGWR
jgi:hypothetical protein